MINLTSGKYWALVVVSATVSLGAFLLCGTNAPVGGAGKWLMLGSLRLPAWLPLVTVVMGFVAGVLGKKYYKGSLLAFALLMMVSSTALALSFVACGLVTV